jgi:hypothetical protein
VSREKPDKPYATVVGFLSIPLNEIKNIRVHFD